MNCGPTLGLVFSCRYANLKTVVKHLPFIALLILSGCSLNTSGSMDPNGGEPGTDAVTDHGLLDLPADGPPVDTGPDDGPGEDAECRLNADCSDGDICNGLETCDPGSHTCIGGTALADGAVCGEYPRMICLDGACGESRCGDGFRDVGRGEFCDDGNDDPGDGCDACQITCGSYEDCSDGDTCNGEETCRTGTGECVNGSPQADGTICGSDPRKICISGVCLVSSCSDGYVDWDSGEQCEGDASEGCTAVCGTGGTHYCESCSWGVCIPFTETCNGVDDDCNGLCDDGFECCAGDANPCTTSCGSEGSRGCSPSCEWASGCSPPAETCNGIDDDCDDACDNGFACCAGTSGPFAYGGCSGTCSCNGSCSTTECSFGTPPANDDCETAIEMDCPGSVEGDMCPATNRRAPVYCAGDCVDNDYAHDVAYKLDVPSGGRQVTLETDGSNFDTILHVRRNGCYYTREAFCNDDRSTSNNSSRIDHWFSGGTYYIMIDSCIYGDSDNDLGDHYVLTCSME